MRLSKVIIAHCGSGFILERAVAPFRFIGADSSAGREDATEPFY